MYHRSSRQHSYVITRLHLTSSPSFPSASAPRHRRAVNVNATRLQYRRCRQRRRRRRYIAVVIRVHVIIAIVALHVYKIVVTGTTPRAAQHRLRIIISTARTAPSEGRRCHQRTDGQRGKHTTTEVLMLHTSTVGRKRFRTFARSQLPRRKVKPFAVCWHRNNGLQNLSYKLTPFMCDQSQSRS